MCGVGLLAAPSVAEAQVLSRLSARVEGTGSLLVSSPQSDAFGFGFGFRGGVGVRLVGPLHLQVFGAFNQWGAKASGALPGRASFVGGSLGVEPRLASIVHLRAEVDLGLSLNGANTDARFTWGLGIGAWFRVASVFDLGPIVRFGGILAAPSESSGNGGPGDAYFINFGLAFSLHGAEEQPAPTPPADTAPLLTAPPETHEPIPPPAPPPPPPPPPTTTVTQPSTGSSGGGDPLGYTTTTTTATPPPTPVATPAAPVEEEEGGRHGRHGRHGRRGGRHGGGHGGRHGGGGGHHRRHH